MAVETLNSVYSGLARLGAGRPGCCRNSKTAISLVKQLKNNKMKIGLLIITTSFFSIFSYGQDTIRVEPSYYYTSQTGPMRSKAFASRVKYAREDIIFNTNYKRIEYCYYYDNERICYGDTYRLIDDSTLLIGDSTSLSSTQTWTYRKTGDGQYLIYRFNNGHYETGLAKELIPLKIIGSVFTITADKSDTLWIADYSFINPNYPYSKPKHIYPKTEIEGDIYELDEVDHPPTLETGEMLPKSIRHIRTDACGISQPYRMIKNMNFIVRKDGSIKNIEQGFGSFDIEYCPQYILELMTIIMQFGQLKPAIYKGEPVNCRYTIAIEMKNE